MASIATSAFGYNQDEGTIFFEGQTFEVAGLRYYWELKEDSNNRHLVRSNVSSAVKGITIASTTQASINKGSTQTEIAFVRCAYGYQQDNFGISTDGGNPSLDTSGSLPDQVVTLNIGNQTGTSSFICGHIKKIQYFPRRLSDTELQEITS